MRALLLFLTLLLLNVSFAFVPDHSWSINVDLDNATVKTKVVLDSIILSPIHIAFPVPSKITVHYGEFAWKTEATLTDLYLQPELFKGINGNSIVVEAEGSLTLDSVNPIIAILRNVKVEQSPNMYSTPLVKTGSVKVDDVAKPYNTFKVSSQYLTTCDITPGNKYHIVRCVPTKEWAKHTKYSSLTLLFISMVLS